MRRRAAVPRRNERRRFAKLALAAGVVLGAAGCGVFGEKKLRRPCPNFLLLGEAKDMTLFRAGPGRDITDVDFRAAIVDFSGTCEHTRSEVEAEFFVEIVVRRGPANRSRAASFEYFVAIPRFYPAPAGKKTFRVEVTFEDNQTRVVYRDEIALKIPLRGGEIGADYDVYLGLQLDSEQLEYNRRRRAR